MINFIKIFSKVLITLSSFIGICYLMVCFVEWEILDLPRIGLGVRVIFLISTIVTTLLCMNVEEENL